MRELRNEILHQGGCCVAEVDHAAGGKPRVFRKLQVGARVAHALGRPLVTGLKKVTVEGASVRCEQEVEGGRDVYVVPLPAVLTVKEGLNLPRYPSVPGRMRARSKPVAVSTPARPAPRLELVRLAVPAGQGRRAESLGAGAAAAPAVVEMLQKAGVL